MSRQEENKREPYEAPQIQTVSSAKILEVLGPAVAGYGKGEVHGHGSGGRGSGSGSGVWSD